MCQINQIPSDQFGDLTSKHILHTHTFYQISDLNQIDTTCQTEWMIWTSLINQASTVKPAILEPEQKSEENIFKLRTIL